MDNNQKKYEYLIDSLKKGKLNIVKKLFDELSKEIMSRDLGREVMREACLYNQLEIVKYVVEHKNKQAIEDFNKNYGFIFYLVQQNQFWNILNYFISDLNMPLSSDIKRAITEMPKEDAEKINHMFEMREVKDSLDKSLQINKIQKNKKLKV